MMKKEGLRKILPLIIILVLVPLVTIVHKYDCGLQENTWFSKDGTTYDFFLYYKSRALMWAGALCACFFVFGIANKDKGNLRDKKMYLPLIPVGVFALFSFLSAIFSEHSEAAIWGGYEQFEGMLVLLSYVTAFCLAYGYVTTEKLVQIVVDAVIVGSLAVSALGAFQAFGMDYIQSDWAKGFLTCMESATKGLTFKLNFAEGVAYSTLYNPNYVGSYVAVALPITVVAAFVSKHIVWKILALVSSIFQIIMLVASQSLTGSIGLVGGLLAGIVFLIPWMKKHWKLTAIGGMIVLVGVLVIGFWKPTMLDKLFASNEREYYLDSVVTDGEEYVITNRNGDTFRGTIAKAPEIPESEKEHLSVSPIQLRLADGTVVPSMNIKADGLSWMVVRAKDGVAVCNAFGRFDYLREIPKIGFKDNYHFATKRGFIWSRTFPLLTKTILLGEGADNFVYAYPNNDYIGKAQLNYNSSSVTKPHNMYLQIWVQDGMFACLAMVAMFIMLWIYGIKRVFGNQEKRPIHMYLIAILCSATGYMIVGLANDSTISVAPIFWTLMGTGFAICAILSREKKKTV